MSEEQMNDSTFGRLFILMIVAMTALTVIIIFIAVYASDDVNQRLTEESERENTQALAERIAPVGTFSATTVAAAPAAEPLLLSGADAYQGCAACHASGVLDAPILGDADGWKDRLSKGIDVLYDSALNGIGTMPAKGGLNLSDENVKAAVDYMVEQVQ